MRLYRKPFGVLINASMSSELENALSRYGNLKVRGDIQDGCKVYELSVEDYAHIVVVVDTGSLRINAMRVSFEPYEFRQIKDHTTKYDNLLDNIISDMRRLMPPNDSRPVE